MSISRSPTSYRKDTPPEGRLGSGLNPLQRIELRSAVKQQRDHVFMDTERRGRVKFSLKYKHESVFYSPTDGQFVPCGWFTIDKLMKNL